MRPWGRARVMRPKPRQHIRYLSGYFRRLCLGERPASPDRYARRAPDSLHTYEGGMVVGVAPWAQLGLPWGGRWAEPSPREGDVCLPR